MPLPLVAPGGTPTSTWGGTMIGITKRCRNKDLAWELAVFLYTDKSRLADRFRATNIIPSIRDGWNDPAFHEKRPYWSDQRLGDQFAALAPHVPAQYTSPFVITAKTKLGEALVTCVQRYKQRGGSGFEPFVRRELKRRADEVRAMIKRNPY